MPTAGCRVMPFKPQNMSNNAAVTADGGEIGRAQALQARAARVHPSVHMNPVLLKPETTTGAQVIVQGKRQASMTARDYFRNRTQFMGSCTRQFSQHFATVPTSFWWKVRGAPARSTCGDGDIANMGFAEAANIPAVLIGDIHRGGVIASIAGTFDILPPEDRDATESVSDQQVPRRS